MVRREAAQSMQGRPNGQAETVALLTITKCTKEFSRMAR